MEILETYCRGKSTHSPCEDAYVITDNFVAVIDGVTSKSDFVQNGMTTGKLAADTISSIIKKLPRECSISDFIEKVNRAINQLYLDISFPHNKEELGFQAVCAIYSDYYHEIWMIGDCQVMVDGRLYLNPKKSDMILSNMRSLIIKCLTSEKLDNDDVDYIDIARNTILPWILKSNVFANNDASDYGYSLINGKDIPDRLIRKIKIDTQKHDIVLATDGYPIVEKTLALSEIRLKEILEFDPGCSTFPSTKALKEGNDSFDDRTYIRFSV